MVLFLDPGGTIGLYGAKGIFADPNFVISGPVIADGAFHHIAATWTGDTTPDGVKLYVDSLLVGTATADTAISTGSTPIQIGRHTILDFEEFAGQIDEVSIYNRALTGSEIQAIFNARSAGKCVP